MQLAVAGAPNRRKARLMLIAACEVSGVPHGYHYHIPSRVRNWSLADVSALAELGFGHYGTRTNRREKGGMAGI